MVDEVDEVDEEIIVFCGFRKKGKMSVNDINDKCQPDCHCTCLLFNGGMRHILFDL